MSKFVIYNREGSEFDYATHCFYEKDNEKQADLMHRRDIDEQVKEWQKSHIGNPPKFYSRITIKEFTDRELNFSNLKV